MRWLLVIVFFSFSLSAQVRKDLVIPKNPKIGLSLSGGGAKGFAHIGVLKVLDSLGIKVDYISGTSMGAIIGGLYASGYTAKDIEKIVLETDFYNVLSNEKTREDASFFSKSTDKYLLSLPIKDGKIRILPRSFSKGQRNIYLLKELFNSVSNVTDFSELPIPFMCIATNLESGKMKIFEKGDLVNSIMASSAFPSLLDPVKIKDSLYIDGAITVNYPSKPLKDKGMDIVIGVNLSQGLATKENLNSIIDILNQIIDFNIQRDTKIQEEYTDINIHPNLKGYNSTSYDDKQKILSLGFSEAEKYLPILDKLPKREERLLKAPINPIFSSVYKIDSLSVENNKIFNQSYVHGKLGLKIPSLQTFGSINKMLDKLYATNNYNLINYDLLQKNDKTYLNLVVNENDTRMFLKFGLHYDEIFHSGLLVNFTAKRFLFKNSILSIDGIVGDSPRYYFNYFVDNGYIPGFGYYSSGMNLSLKDNLSNIYQQRKWFRNEFYIQSVWLDRYAIGGGLSFDYFDKKGILDIAFTDSRRFYNPYVFIKSDTQDDKEFPSRGFFMDIEGKIIDIFNSRIEKKTLQAKANFAINIPVRNFLTYNLNLFGGFSIGNTTDYSYYQYNFGGIFMQKLGNFISFEGYNFGQRVTDNLLTASHRIQFRFYKNFYAIASYNMANLFNKIDMKTVLRINESSVGITLGYKSPFGQIKINVAKPINSGQVLFNVILGHWF